jgi:hypothetical protein
VSLLSKMNASVGIDDERQVSGLVAHAIAAKGRHRETSAVGRLDQNLAIMLKGQTAEHGPRRRQNWTRTAYSYVIYSVVIYILDSQEAYRVRRIRLCGRSRATDSLARCLNSLLVACIGDSDAMRRG